MNNSPDLRYETKFVLSKRLTPAFVTWVRSKPKFRLLYPPRTVNSLYFDTFAFDCVKDNIVGMPNRRKFRLRWYECQDKEAIQKVRLEIKSKINRTGHKTVLPIDMTVDDLKSNRLKEIGNAIHRSVPNSRAIPASIFLNPVLHVSYVREYYEIQYGIRLTIDTNISFGGLLTSSMLYSKRKVSYPRNIAELKFGLQDKDTVSGLLRDASVSPVRHSKYLAGLATLGYTIYM